MCSKCKEIEPFLRLLRASFDAWHFVKGGPGILGDSTTSAQECIIQIDHDDTDCVLFTIRVMAGETNMQIGSIPERELTSVFSQAIVTVASLPSFGDSHGH